MNAYDFDNTIYDGESLFDFFLFCISKKKRLVIHLPLVIYILILYKLTLLTDKKLYTFADKLSSMVINNKNDITNYVNEFWKKNEYKLKPYFINKLKKADIIITASPRFLIGGIAYKLKTKNIICSEYNLNTGKFDFICFRHNKVDIFKKLYPNAIVNEFYTDSLNDIPMLKLAEHAYLVKKNEAPKLIDASKYN